MMDTSPFMCLIKARQNFVIDPFYERGPVKMSIFLTKTKSNYINLMDLE